MSFDHIFDELNAKARAVQENPMEIPAVEAEGTSRDDLVTLTISGGEFTQARVDPRALRRSNAELGDLIIQAANAALRAHTEALTQAMQDSTTDFGSLQNDLTRIRDEAQDTMRKHMEAMQSMLAQAAGQRERYDL